MTLAAAVSPTRADANSVVQRQPSPGKITTRPSLPADAEFMLELYAATHEQELAELGWSLTENRSFVIMQAQAEEWKLGRRYPDMDRVTIGIESTPIGRLLVCMREEVLHVVDLSLMPRFRGQGVGTQLMREILGEAREELVPVKIRVLKDSRSFEFVNRLGFDEPLDFGRYVEVTWSPPDVGDSDARADRAPRRGARVRVPEQPASAVRDAANEAAVDGVTEAPDVNDAPEAALLTEQEAWAMLRDGAADETELDEAPTREPEFAAFVEPVPQAVVVEDVFEDLPVVEDVVVDLPVVEDVVVDLPVVEDVVEDLPVVEDVVEDLPVVEALPVVEDVIVALPVVEDVVEDLPAVEDLPVVEALSVVEDVVEDLPVVEALPAVEDLPVVEDVVEDLPVVEALPVVENLPVFEALSVVEDVVEDLPAVEDLPVVEALSVVEDVVEDLPAVEDLPVVEA